MSDSNSTRTFRLIKCDEHDPRFQYRHLESIPVGEIFPVLANHWGECVGIFESLKSDDNDEQSGFFIPNTPFHIGGFLDFYAHHSESFLLKVTQLRDEYLQSLYRALSYSYCAVTDTGAYIMFDHLNLDKDFFPPEIAVETVCTPDFISALRDEMAADLPDFSTTPAIKSCSKPSGPSELEL